MSIIIEELQYVSDLFVAFGLYVAIFFFVFHFFGFLFCLSFCWLRKRKISTRTVFLREIKFFIIDMVLYEFLAFSVPHLCDVVDYDMVKEVTIDTNLVYIPCLVLIISFILRKSLFRIKPIIVHMRLTNECCVL